MTISQAELFKILGVETRLQIIELLKEKGPQGVNELSEALGIRVCGFAAFEDPQASRIGAQ